MSKASMIVRNPVGRGMEALDTCGRGKQSKTPCATSLAGRGMKWRFTAARHDPLAGARGSVHPAAGTAVVGLIATSKNTIIVDADETTAQGLSANANPNGIGVENKVAAIRDGRWTDLKIVSQIGSKSTVAS